MEEFVSDFTPEVGMSYLVNYGNSNNCRIHVRALVDNHYYVIRTWANGKWFYELESIYYFHCRARYFEQPKKSDNF